MSVFQGNRNKNKSQKQNKTTTKKKTERQRERDLITLTGLCKAKQSKAKQTMLKNNKHLLVFSRGSRGKEGYPFAKC